jgi:hypothetical protein
MVHYWGRSAILPCVGLLVAWTESSGCPRRAQWQRRGVPPRTRARARARRHPALPRPPLPPFPLARLPSEQGREHPVPCEVD